MTLALLAAAGGLGAILRFIVDRTVTARKYSGFGLGTFVVNMSGALALGTVLGLASTATLTTTSVDILGTGFLGGFTTFSTLTYESFFLLSDEHRWHFGLLNYFGSLMGGLTLYFLAFEASRHLT